MRKFWIINIAIAASLSLLSSQSAEAAKSDEINFYALLSPAGVDESIAKANAVISYDPETHRFFWMIHFKGLDSNPIEAKFYNPQSPDPQQTELQIPLDVRQGWATLTDGQIDELMAGKWVVMLATRKYPQGEVEGRVVPGKILPYRCDPQCITSEGISLPLEIQKR